MLLLRLLLSLISAAATIAIATTTPAPPVFVFFREGPKGVHRVHVPALHGNGRSTGRCGLGLTAAPGFS